MTVPEDWRVQASFKFGPNLQGLLNVRADNIADLDVMCGDLADRIQSGDFLAELNNALTPPTVGQAQQNIQGGFPQAQQVQAPSCSHGPMKDLAHKGYRKRWYCPAPKGQQQCQALD